jgi:hypothetical protein
MVMRGSGNGTEEVEVEVATCCAVPTVWSRGEEEFASAMAGGGMERAECDVVYVSK